MNLKRIRRNLLAWYRTNARDLPWRQTREPYPIWLSEVMLQQTRVVAVIPYYEKFLTLFPTVEALAVAPEQELLAAWAGLGYYSRARNLQSAARDIVAQGGFPQEHESIAALPGIGAYTAAAVASIAFNLPHAAIDGNVLRVVARLDAERGPINVTGVRQKLAARADELLERGEPGIWNQAMMELGATLCTPRNPQCLICPVAEDCEARRLGIAAELPVKAAKPSRRKVEYCIAMVERHGRVLFLQRASNDRRLADFWELPTVEQLPGFEELGEVGVVRHAITVNDFAIRVLRGRLRDVPTGGRWVGPEEMGQLPITTVSKKALKLAWKPEGEPVSKSAAK